ncbi:MAG: hypothetical protein MRERV_14c002 [Mycoplasmataceae bacterium RV_VA103A]|nr:MAG: hypothetical protein MRERV_14c002 [Mycoplasmataceae bacterium RV_VA103A]
MDICKECNKQLDNENEYYNLNIGDETERKWNKNKFNLCVECWKQKKESYKSLVGKWNKYKWEDKKIKVWKMKKYQSGGGMEEIGNCQTCKKWDDEYEVKNRYENYCSLNCEKNKDKGNDNDPERERERERQKLFYWNNALRS